MNRFTTFRKKLYSDFLDSMKPQEFTVFAFMINAKNSLMKSNLILRDKSKADYIFKSLFK